MAAKEHVNEVKESKVTEKTTSHVEGVPVETVTAHRRSRQWIIAFVAIIAVVYLMLVVGGLWFFNALANHHNGIADTTNSMMEQQSGRRGYSVTGDRTYSVSQSSSDGLTTTTTNTTYTQTQGVVTAVNSDNIVVAGGGKTQTVKTNTSTTYANGTKPAVNDTVVIVGTKDGATITATQIAVYN